MAFPGFSKSCWDEFLDLALLRIGWEQLGVEIKPWRTVPEDFTFPLEFYIEEDQEEPTCGEWSLPTPPPPAFLPFPGPRLSQPIPRPSPPRPGPPAPPRRPPGPDLARIIEAHSQTLLRLETRFTATGLTRVLAVGPVESGQRLFRRIWSVGSWDPQSRARGG